MEHRIFFIGGAAGFAWIAALTWFYSSRPRRYLRKYVPREDWLSAWRDCRRPEWRTNHRVLAAGEFACACILGLIALFLGD